jgi:hypothetical protein
MIVEGVDKGLLCQPPNVQDDAISDERFGN